ncbi:MAG: hydroxyethylthiazole kinase [Spirochaetota bacterium]
MDAAAILDKVRTTPPLVHHITNWVTIYDCAAVTRAFGAFPVMAHAKEEAADMTSLAQSLVLNIGTLTAELIDAMVTAGRRANEKGIPIVLDAVGAGATPMRTEAAKKLLKEIHIDIIKGNASEIAVLAGMSAETRGVESGKVDGDLSAIARTLSEERNAVIVITGVRDIIAYRKTAYGIDNGHALMGRVVGTGCTAASAIGCFAAVEKDLAAAAASALICYGIAGERAAVRANAPAAFKIAFHDEIALLTAQAIRGKERFSTGER